MARIIHCIKLGKEAEGLDFPPYPGDIGIRVWNNISKDAWNEWMNIQIRLVNENRLNLSDERARKYLLRQMEKFLFENENVNAQGYTPPISDPNS